jgi:hypothetical protein
MQYNREVIRDELSILQAKASQKAEDASKQERALAEKERNHAEQARLQIDRLSFEAEGLKEAFYKRQIREPLPRRNKVSQPRSKAKSNVQILEDMFNHTHEWLCPPNYTEVYQESRALREEGTCHWISSNAVFETWRDAEWSLQTGPTKSSLSTNALWVYGTWALLVLF